MAAVDLVSFVMDADAWEVGRGEAGADRRAGSDNAKWSVRMADGGCGVVVCGRDGVLSCGIGAQGVEGGCGGAGFEVEC